MPVLDLAQGKLSQGIVTLRHGQEKATPPAVTDLSNFIKRERGITWALCRNNLPGNLAGFMGGFIPRVLACPASFTAGGIAFLRVMITCLIWTYIFDIANTTSSVEEDRLNKPHRPIPSGLITVLGARARWLISWCLSPAIVGMICGKWPAFYIVLEQLWVYGFYVWPAYRHWLTKSIMVTGATFIMLRLLNFVVSDIEEWSVGAVPDLLVCVWTLTTIHLQDFRDVEGDYKTHAVTIPIILSPEQQTRLRQMTACILFSGQILSLGCTWSENPYGSVISTGLFFQLMSSILIYYTIKSRSRHQDRIMYRWWMATGFCLINHVYNLYLLQ